MLIELAKEDLLLVRKNVGDEETREIE